MDVIAYAPANPFSHHLVDHRRLSKEHRRLAIGHKAGAELVALRERIGAAPVDDLCGAVIRDTEEVGVDSHDGAVSSVEVSTITHYQRVTFAQNCGRQ